MSKQEAINTLRQRIGIAKCSADNGNYDCGISIDEAEQVLQALLEQAEPEQATLPEEKRKITRFKFNLNEHIRFRPTEYGRVIYKAYWMAYSTSTMDKPRELKTDADGWVEMQLWDFMRIFGSHFQGGFSNQICETEVILIDTVSEQLAYLSENKIQLQQAEPEPGEFTKQCQKVINELNESKRPEDCYIECNNAVVHCLEKLREACDLIDCLIAEKQSQAEDEPNVREIFCESCTGYERKAEPEPGEFTKDIQSRLCSASVDGPSYDWLYAKLLEACGHIDRLTREKQAQAERIEKLEGALESISEYWNRSENDRAMNDALYHMIDIAEQALKG